MIRSIIWTVVFCVIAVILQSAVISRIAFFGIVPDLALCILVFSAYINGTMTGQISGFFSGLFFDFLSPAPLGMNCLIRTLIGALTGIFKGQFFLDIIFMPVILCVLATVLKALLVFILHLIMGQAVPAYSFTNSVFWIELGLNALSAPLLFFLLKKFKPMLTARS
ncbi:MAG: rod shape-determining protein MreD [Treponema sp.]|jgi:rod shape-determining protein MreD|nr:rod shape-determining protein MreD [Treponema sp.]